MQMLDRLNRLALLLRPLRSTLLVLMALTFIAMAAVIITDSDQKQNLYLLPLLVAFLWFLSTYALILNFQIIPDTHRGQKGLINKTKAAVLRSWYWLIGLIFFISTLGVLGFSWKLIGIWLKDY